MFAIGELLVILVMLAYKCAIVWVAYTYAKRIGLGWLGILLGMLLDFIGLIIIWLIAEHSVKDQHTSDQYYPNASAPGPEPGSEVPPPPSLLPPPPPGD